jgi:predicted acetyltransferase
MTKETEKNGKDNVLSFIEPHDRHRESYDEATRAGLHGLALTDEEARRILDDLELWQAEELDESQLKEAANDAVPAAVEKTESWLMHGDRFIGAIAIHHAPNKEGRRKAGHIHYNLRADEHDKGHDDHIVNHAFEQAKMLGMLQALLSCNDDHLAAIKAIEAAGGKLMRKSTSEGKHVRHYWIDLEKPK